MTTVFIPMAALAAAAAVLMWMPAPTVPWTPSPGDSDRRRSLFRRRRSRGRTPPGQGPTRAGGTDAVSTRSVVPEGLELLALALLGGGALAEAARTVSLALPEGHGAGLGAVGAALHRGLDTDRAWAEAGPQWEPARRSMELASVAGVGPGPALRQAAADLRAATVSDVEVGTARLGVRMVLPLGLAFLPAFVLTTVLPLVLALTQDLAW